MKYGFETMNHAYEDKIIFINKRDMNTSFFEDLIKGNDDVYVIATKLMYDLVFSGKIVNNIPLIERKELSSIRR